MHSHKKQLVPNHQRQSSSSSSSSSPPPPAGLFTQKPTNFSRSSNLHTSMANDAALRSALVWLAGVVLAVGIFTFSFKKMVATYVVGVVGISGVFLPDWCYFDRDFSRWTSPVTAEERASVSALRSGPTRFRIYPLRFTVYSIVYGYGLYRWWRFVSS